MAKAPASDWSITQAARLVPLCSDSGQAATSTLPSKNRPLMRHRDPHQRSLYLTTALAQIPRLLTLVDRNPYHTTYGCFDRGFWHYRTSDFPSGMFQEGVLPLAIVWAHPFPGNPWYQEPRIKELALAGIRFGVRWAHTDGSCDDYYPFERALGATVFSLYAMMEAYQLLGVHDLEILEGLTQRAVWLLQHDETGHLANHQAWAALALYQAYRLSGQPRLLAGAECRIRTVLSWQSAEGWFREYDGCDPGYLSVTIDALAKYWKESGDPVVREALHRAVPFARHFMHPDGSFGGHYGSRGTRHFYPHGMELLAREEPAAAEMADGFLRSLACTTAAAFDDDRLFCHRLPNLLQAYRDWCPEVAASSPPPETEDERHFPEAQLYVRRSADRHAVVAYGKGGTFALYREDQPPVSDTGIVVEFDGGRVCSANWQSHYAFSITPDRIEVSGPLHWSRHEVASPGKMVLFRIGLLMLGKRLRNTVRTLLQRRLITGRRPAPVRFTRTIIWGPPVQVIDRVELTDQRCHVRRLALSSDHHPIYTAAGNVFQQADLSTWTDLADRVEELNRHRRIEVSRSLDNFLHH